MAKKKLSSLPIAAQPVLFAVQAIEKEVHHSSKKQTSNKKIDYTGLGLAGGHFGEYIKLLTSGRLYWENKKKRK